MSVSLSLSLPCHILFSLVCHNSREIFIIIHHSTHYTSWLCFLKVCSWAHKDSTCPRENSFDLLFYCLFDAHSSIPAECMPTIQHPIEEHQMIPDSVTSSVSSMVPPSVRIEGCTPPSDSTSIDGELYKCKSLADCVVQ